ncbi:MAG TPA: adenine phosphoribosyltransferase [Solirubrobacteraceae bacterium]|nr:adenine phosphoribosyltransferase [Solirubrobacteraceae bacterium]
MASERLRALVREVPDFPREGILFRDITPLLADPVALREAVDALASFAAPLKIDAVVAAEARGFLLGPALAMELEAAFVLARKPGRLPRETVAVQYQLEYGLDHLELQSDAIAPGARVLVHDDLLATGGTAGALCELAESLGGDVRACAFLVELEGLGGRERLAGHEVHSLVSYAR